MSRSRRLSISFSRGEKKRQGAVDLPSFVLGHRGRKKGRDAYTAGEEREARRVAFVFLEGERGKKKERANPHLSKFVAREEEDRFEWEGGDNRRVLLLYFMLGYGGEEGTQECLLVRGSLRGKRGSMSGGGESDSDCISL